MLRVVCLVFALSVSSTCRGPLDGSALLRVALLDTGLLPTPSSMVTVALLFNFSSFQLCVFTSERVSEACWQKNRSLWLEHTVQEGRSKVLSAPTSETLSDTFTKSLSQAEGDRCYRCMNFHMGNFGSSRHRKLEKTHLFQEYEVRHEFE